jgi:hypothetical protein
MGPAFVLVRKGSVECLHSPFAGVWRLCFFQNPLWSVNG